MRFFWILLIGMYVPSLYTMEEKKTTRLHKAFWYGQVNLQKAREYLEQGISVDVQDEDGHTPLHLAAAIGHLKAVRFLIEKKANLEIKDDWNDTPFSLATRKGRWSVAFALLNADASIHVTNNQGCTPFYYAAEKYGGENLALKLIEKGTDVTIKGYNNQTALHWAAKRQNKELVDAFLAKGADVNAKAEYGKMPLNWLVEAREKPEGISIVKKLLKAGAVLSPTVLHSAIMQYKNSAIVETLLEAGALVHTKNWGGSTLFHLARLGDAATCKTAITYPRTMSPKYYAIAKTLLLIHTHRKDSLLAKVPKDYFLPVCCPNINYVRGTAQERANWHISELNRILQIKNRDGELAYQVTQVCKSWDKKLLNLLDPEKVEQHRQVIEKGYGVAQEELTFF